LADEIAFVRLYLKCEQVRFEGRLRVSWDVAPNAEALLVPPMLLHPLVENAIKHGQQADRPLEVHISARRQGSSLVLEVRNSGTLERATTDLLPAGPGVGLQNVRGRLTHLFPGAHTFSLFETDGKVVARLTIPGART
jgi:two-component system, LytTR family, sensor kinase